MSFLNHTKKWGHTLGVFALLLLFSTSQFFVLENQKANAQASSIASGGINSALSCGGGDFLKEKLGSVLDSVGLGDLLGGGSITSTVSSVTNVALTVPTTDAPVESNTDNIKDRANEQKTKEFTLDCVARELARVTLRQMTDSLVDWINNGFEGSPLFIEDPLTFFQGIGDTVSGALLQELGLTQLCSLSADNLRLALKLNFGAKGGIREKYSCTLRDLALSGENIFSDLSARSLEDYLDVSQNPSNTPFGAYFGLINEQGKITSQAQEKQKMVLDWSGGFFSVTDKDGNIVTPGKVIEDQLSNVLGSEVRQLELADEFNEITSALVNALINKVMSSGGSLRN